MEHYRPARHAPAPAAARRRCHRCNGTGREVCQICQGKGLITRGMTSGPRPRPKLETCSGCFGTRHRRCMVCGGEGFTL